ncbi:MULTISPECIES: DUF397 domain-containing protein [unclassified Saccharopolyspora]|uniref:DUF397 domain-containing protein n=1 Tax=unclassified Saccharopolyspora TaxID=2646250 RepID=UPI001CD485C7|nr:MULTISPECIES: DUF397 domain-containing protein [unclassified Saccharopolyspora]MCA1190295.1 DUF397 domain-containing protein [Saccharopolyspora sp. 6T]MCA1196017.1 DUF397 domain-containing protein [Saccharopolyspora sp. 6V]MCA1229356.1 DUF397 domain-containing protein [Saccharopolyspora sp. 6M]MCA1283242.1 DUF397 domain-containing protein [Saccharopolyspora sp. 7B]
MTDRIADWRKSTRSHAANGCVEVGSGADRVGVRDSKLGAGSPVLLFTTAEWASFTARTRRGAFDR